MFILFEIIVGRTNSFLQSAHSFFMSKAWLLFIGTCLFSLPANTQTCNWVKLGPAGATNPLNSANNYTLINSSSALDGLGNIISVSGNLLICGGNDRYDYFLSKYDPNGSLLWRHKFTYGRAGADVTVDKSGNIYIVSTFFQKIDETILNLDFDRSYILKFSPGGSLIWYKSFGPVTELSCDNGYQKSFLKYHDASNSLMLYASPSFYFSVFPFLDTSYTAIPHPSGTTPVDLLISRIDTGGNRIWSKIFRNDSTLKAGSRGLDFNSQGQLVISGYFENYLRFNDTTVLTGTATWYKSH